MSDDRKDTELGKAICAAMSEIKRLEKRDNNAFAKYKYTSVDDFKDNLRPVMAENGLWLIVNELKVEPFEHEDSKGKKSTHVSFTLSIAMNHISGENGYHEKITVMLPYVGAQTTGQAKSYAIKEYLKSKLLASSGDLDDADAHDETETMSKQSARSLYAELSKEFRDTVKSGTENLPAWAERRAPSIAVLPTDWKLELRRLYKEAMATGGAKYGRDHDEEPDTNVFHPYEFLEELKGEMDLATTQEIVMEVWENSDVEATLTSFENVLQQAFDYRKSRLESLDMPEDTKQAVDNYSTP